MTSAAPPFRIPALSLVALQLTLGVVGIAIATLAAASGDAVLLVPLTPSARAALPARALVAGTRLLGAGTLPGSLIVRRDDGAAVSLIGFGIVSIPVPARLCGVA